MGSLRIKKINELLKRELGKIILKEIDFPQGVLVTLTKVETSKDLALARVFISAIPEKETKPALQTLNRAVYFLQQKLNRRLLMRPVPRIEFCQDKEMQRQVKIDRILEKIKKEPGQKFDKGEEI